MSGDQHLLDQFMAAALAGLVARPIPQDSAAKYLAPEVAAASALVYAEAMLQARNRHIRHATLERRKEQSKLLEQWFAWLQPMLRGNTLNTDQMEWLEENHRWEEGDWLEWSAQQVQDLQDDINALLSDEDEEY